MVREIVKDINILSKVSTDFDFRTMQQVITDLIDTAKAHEENCAGLAAVQIGMLVKAFVVKENNKFVPYINPRIIQYSPDTYIAEEGCLSLDGTRKVKRHSWIKIMYTTRQGKMVVERVDGFRAEVMQHEMMHLKGLLL